MTQSIDLIYAAKTPSSSKSSGFFQLLDSVKKETHQFRVNQGLHKITPIDRAEIGRGSGYAIFPELEKQVMQKKPITIEAVTDCFISRGITDELFINKILSMLLQNKVGLQFCMGKLLQNILFENEHNLFLNQNYSLKVDVLDSKKVYMVFDGVLSNIGDEAQREDCLAVKIKIGITPTKVSLNQFKISLINEHNETATKAFKFLKENQASIFEKILAYFKNLFDINHDTQLDDEASDGIKWGM